MLENIFIEKQSSVQYEDTIMFFCDAKSSKVEDNRAYLLKKHLISCQTFVQ